MDIENASEHITEHVPNPLMRVQSLLNSIEGCTDPTICAIVAAVSNEANGMQDEFKLAVANLFPECPVAAKVAKKLNNAQIYGLGGNFKAGTGPKTGVELRCHKPPEFAQLSDAHRDELLGLRPPKKGRGKKKTHHKKGERGGKRNSHGRNKPWEKKIKRQVAAVIKRQKAADTEEQNKETKELAELARLISAVQPAAVFYSASTSNAATAAVRINAVFKQRRGIP